MARGLKFQIKEVAGLYYLSRDCTICLAKTKELISFAVTAKLICVFVFAYAKRRFSHNEAHMIIESHHEKNLLKPYVYMKGAD